MVLKSTIAKTKILVINEGHRLRATKKLFAKKLEYLLFSKTVVIA